MGFLDWLLKPFRKSQKAKAGPAAGTAPVHAPAAPSRPPQTQKKETKARKPRPERSKKAAAARQGKKRKARKERPPAPPPPRSTGVEVLSLEEAERRYGDLFQEPPRAEAGPLVPPPEEAPTVRIAEPMEPPRRERRPPSEAAELRRLAQLPHFEALLARTDALLAVPEAEPRHLLAAKRQLVEDWRALGPLPSAHAHALRTGLEQRLDALSARGRAAYEAMDQERQANLEKKQALLAEARALTEREDLRGAGPAMGQLRAAWRAAGPVPRAEIDALEAAFAEAQDRLRQRLAEARKKGERERQEQLDQLEQLVRQAEALARARDPEVAAERAKALQAGWKRIRPRGARAEVDALWTRFRAACDEVFARRQSAREQRAHEALARREDLLARAEALAEGEPLPDPEVALDKLMSEWKRLGPAPRAAGDALWSRFRAACDRVRNPPPVMGGTDETPLQFRPFAGLPKPEEE